MRIRLAIETPDDQVWLIRNMPLPRAVQEQLARSEALHAQLYGNTNLAPDAAPVEAPVALVQNEPLTPDSTPAPIVAPAAVEVPGQVQVQPEPVSPAADDSTWELKYRVLNGKYTAEVPRMAAQIRELTQTVETLKAQLAQPVQPAQPAALDSVRETYGDDFANAVTSVATEQVQRVRDELAPTLESIRQDAAQRVRNDFLRDLGALVPNYAVIDAMPAFSAYLDEFDAQSGRQRREFFNEADASNNAPRIATFFKDFSRAIQPAPKPAPAAPAAPSVEHLITPSSSASSEAPQGKKTWTQAEVNQFYANSRAQGGSKPYGIYSEAEFARIDSDITAAIAEGRYLG